MKWLISLCIILTMSYSEFLKSENIVIDSTQNLMWQDNIEVKYQEDITLGKVYCEELVLNGYIDWRLATIKELQSLLDQEGKKNFFNKTFEYLSDGKYWSDTPNVVDKEQYWYIDFKSGVISNEDKGSINHIMCVREHSVK